MTNQGPCVVHWQPASLLTNVGLLVVLDVLGQLEVAGDDRHLPKEEITLRHQVQGTLRIPTAYERKSSQSFFCKNKRYYPLPGFLR